MIQTAQNAYDNGKYAMAYKAYHHVFVKQPQNLEALEGLARSCNRLKKYEEGLQHCRAALDIDSNLIWPHCLLSYLYSGLGRVEDCRREAALALQLGADQWEPNFCWGVLLLNDNKADEAIPFLERAASISPDNWYVNNGLRAAYLKKKDIPKNNYFIKQMLRLRPNALLAISLHLSTYKYLYAGLSVFLYAILIGLYLILLSLSQEFKRASLLWPPALCSVSLIGFGLTALKFVKRRSSALTIIFVGLVSGVMLLIIYFQIK